MPSKRFAVNGIGTVQVQKLSSSKSIRIRVNADGNVRVTQPTWLPYNAGLLFVAKKQKWLQAQIQPVQMHNGQRIGKSHTLVIKRISGQNILPVSTRLNAIEALVSASLSASEEQVQLAAQKVARRALKQEAEQLLPQRLKILAEQFNFNYQSVSIRRLTARWGSCSSKQEITLNFYLMQLPWDLIDYVLLHELVHTVNLNHSRDFWNQLERCLPDYRQRRKLLKNYKPTVLSPVKA